MNIEICQTDRFLPELITLITQLDAYQAALYPTQSNHAESIDKLKQIKTYIYIAKLESNIVGCAILALPETPFPEVKRVFVCADYRGRGIATLLMMALLEKAKALNLKHIYLETGIYQPEAIKLYQRLGFDFISEYGHYQYDPLSVYMMKLLKP
ncbi:Histone acetyltransferase HPA2 and acetyltransferase [Yersinia rohdei]|uniref:GNAT family N-acetyltransferase n=1 Tax=Yersinia rohdei TaxID=29485 RepID=UPI00061BA02C|nr:GNAT family N-acetyltransferase [Yersinia rohdei]CND99850.1 Histone acetyltransferase HPA2 and acetyltransferase [Yersinia rohdei]